jgi:hypothetical protein
MENLNGSSVGILEQNSINQAVSALLRGEKLFISDIGYLGVFSVSGRKTVFLKPLVSDYGRRESDPYGLNEIIGKPLKEGSAVKIPALGEFRPKTAEDGSLKVSYIMAPLLRKLVNGEEKWDPKPVAAEPVKSVETAAPVESADTAETAASVGAVSEAAVAAVQPVRSVSTVGKTVEEAPAKKQGDIIPWDADSRDEGKKKRRRRHKSRFSWDRVFTYLIIAAVACAFMYWLHKSFYRGPEVYRPLQQRSEDTAEPLTAIAERNYGNSAYWIYIYEYNRARLSSPINIPADTKIEIPDLKEVYDVDVADTEEIANAILQGNAILNVTINKE